MSALVRTSTRVANWARPYVDRMIFAGRIELQPPSPAELPTIQREISSLVRSAATGAWTQVTVKEAFQNAAVVAEVCVWFFVGEIIGRRSIIGYKI